MRLLPLRRIVFICCASELVWRLGILCSSHPLRVILILTATWSHAAARRTGQDVRVGSALCFDELEFTVCTSVVDCAVLVRQMLVVVSF